MLLSRKQILTSADSIHFYYRRIKRIVPIYVFIVLIALIACYFLISRFEFDSIVSDAISSLFFYSNFPFVHKTEYFDMKSKYQFFLHTWSLSCELQFYLFVPLLILIINKLTNKNFFFTLLFVSSLCVLSFCRQVFSTSNAKHMTLDGRIWQFMFGFLAHFVYKSKLLDWTIKSEQNVCCKLFCWIRNLTPIALLVWLLTFPVIDLMERQVQRALVVLFTALIISIRQDNSVLSGDTLVNLGDVSYSVYLVHWPIFTMHRFLEPNLYENVNNVDHIVGSYLIGLSVLLGYLVETKFKRILGLIKNWRHLLTLLFVLYLSAGISLTFLHKNALNLFDFTRPNTKSSMAQRLNTTLSLWNSRDSTTPFSNQEALWLNKEIASVETLGTGHTRLLKTYRHIGKGNKTIVVFGNSHAYLMFGGIVQFFKPIAKEITLISEPACVLGDKQHQHYILSAARRRRCTKFNKNAVKLFQSYKQKIDIIIPIIGWFGYKDFSPEESAKLQAIIQNFYNVLNNAANEVVFAPRLNLAFSKPMLTELEKRLILNQRIDDLGETKQVVVMTKKKMLATEAGMRRILETVKCPKCVKIDWIKLFCDDEYCPAIDRRNILYFLDEHHPTIYGSFVMGQYLFNAYENYMEKQT
ncbi:hypothetical protein M3Y97_01051500 [Aphelenchoides bicaudatus]|nr:hypothetical protein M3Y97_01051500 [Aphelenchoides bicaudatus]